MTLDDLVDPKFHSLVTVARRLIEERCARGVASPAEQLAVVALAEQPTRATRPRCVRGSRQRSSVRRFGWSPRRRSRITSAWLRDWRTKRIGTTTVALARRCTDRGWSGPGNMGARYARRPDGVRCRVPPASGTCPPVSVLEARQRRLPVLSSGGGLPALLSVLSTASLRAGECGHRNAAADYFRQGLPSRGALEPPTYASTKSSTVRSVALTPFNVSTSSPICTSTSSPLCRIVTFVSKLSALM